MYFFYTPKNYFLVDPPVTLFRPRVNACNTLILRKKNPVLVCQKRPSSKKTTLSPHISYHFDVSILPTPSSKLHREPPGFHVFNPEFSEQPGRQWSFSNLLPPRHPRLTKCRTEKSSTGAIDFSESSHPCLSFILTVNLSKCYK